MDSEEEDGYDRDLGLYIGAQSKLRPGPAVESQ